MKNVVYIANAQHILEKLLRELPEEIPIELSNSSSQVHLLVIHDDMNEGPTSRLLGEEQLFIQKVQSCVEKNLGDISFCQETLCKELGMSRTSLYRKLKRISGLNPTAFIRKVRLEKAERLLQDSEFNISEIAYEVGFNDLSYFSNCFKEMFGISPSAKRLKMAG